MRQIGRIKLGYFPLPPAEAERIRRFLVFPEQSSAAVDPCVGDGGAFKTVTAGADVLHYGIELDSFRAEQAQHHVREVIQGSAFDVHCPVESFSLLYLNPPYDFEVGEGRNARMEQIFLEHCYRWLKPGGVLVFVVPWERLTTCSQVLTVHFRDKRIYRPTDSASTRYKQAVLFGARRSRRERDRLSDADVGRARGLLYRLTRDESALPPLPDAPDTQYPVPTAGPVNLTHRGLPLDQVEDLLKRSPAYRQAGRILFAEESEVSGRPLTPLHGGHVGLLATSGLLNGIFGQGRERHAAHWESIKVVDTSEEEEDGKTIIRERERFTHRVTLVFQDGRTAMLGER
ncbi:MAG: class I SAM-dependent methyltransferase, partial [bacterium]|nr:class I SAM-dependent methyltransferase [bacterium]